jgi:hypothetical protein
MLPLPQRYRSVDRFVGDRIESRWLTWPTSPAPVHHVTVIPAIRVERQSVIREKPPAFSICGHTWNLEAEARLLPGPFGGTHHEEPRIHVERYREPLEHIEVNSLRLLILDRAQCRLADPCPRGELELGETFGLPQLLNPQKYWCHRHASIIRSAATARKPPTPKTLAPRYGVPYCSVRKSRPYSR